MNVWDNPKLDDVAEFAAARMQQVAPGATLVRVIGIGLDGDGRIDLQRTHNDFLSRWEFAFYDVDEKRWLTLSWLGKSFAFADAPLLDARAGNCGETQPIVCATHALPSSSIIASHFAQVSDIGFQGGDDDVLIITSDPTGEDVVVAMNSLVVWRAPLAFLERGVVSSHG